MYSANARPIPRPRPPGQRRSSHLDRRDGKEPSPELDSKLHSTDTAKSPQSRPVFSDLKNVVDDTSVDTVHAPSSPLPRHVPKSTSSFETPPMSQTSVLDPSLCEAPAITQDKDQNDDDFDPEWLGALERHELEELLLEASRKVREREQKLVVAANIGKALLEKNLTLRTGIMSSMASSSSLFGLSDIEAMIVDNAGPQAFTHNASLDALAQAPSYETYRPMNSPPTTDIDIHSQANDSPTRGEGDITPIAQPVTLPGQDSGYFSRPSISSANDPNNLKLAHGETPARGSAVSTWIPSDAGLVVSQPCSPSASVSSFASHSLLSPHTSSRDPTSSRHRSRPSLLQLQAIEAQRQLASLGEQNDILHQQISELQAEAENARHEGSKRLSRLNKEIRGLRAELEAATHRNVELEASNTSARPTPTSRSPLRPIAVHRRPDPSSPLLLRGRSRQDADAPSTVSLTPAEVNNEPVSHPHGLVPSTSNLEAMVRSEAATNGESALVAQLLAKIKELEETNAAMAKAEEDFGSRVGRAMEEDERLRDAFNSVGQDLGTDSTIPAQTVHDSATLNHGQSGFITPSHSLQSLSSVGSTHASSLVSSVSPSQKRRAPGNRHVIEHRKTVRTAIRRAKKELAADIWGPHSDASPSRESLSRSSVEHSPGTYSIDLSGDSSAASSPRRYGLSKKASHSSIAFGPAGRPRIRITPSIEDLGRRRKTQEEVITGPPHESSTSGEWQDLTSPTASTFHQQASLRPSDAVPSFSHHRSISPNRGLNDPEGTADAHGQQQVTRVPFLHSNTVPYLSPSQKSFNPTARVRRSRSRSSSFGSDIRSEFQAGPFQRNTDPFMNSPSGWERPRSPLSPASASSNRGRTLGSELGSIFGGDDRKHDFDDDLPQRRRPTANSSIKTSNASRVQSLVLRASAQLRNASRELQSELMVHVDSGRPTANVGRLVPENQQEHEDDLECVLTQSVHGNVEDVLLDNSPLRLRDAALLARVVAEERGAWLADQPIIETGGLQSDDEPRSAQFDLINAVVEQEPVTWADDDDYGRTITQREAIKLGLLAPSASPFASRGARPAKGNGLLFGSSRVDGKKRQQPDGNQHTTPFRLEIESSEQVEHRLRIEGLLRRRREELLRERGHSEDWDNDPLDRERENQLIATYAPTPQRLHEKRRRALAEGRESGWLTPSANASPIGRDPRRSTQQWVRDVASVSPAISRRGADDNAILDLDHVRPEDGEFELLDCPSWKKQGGRGTDYFPTSFRARYQPAMVKQRVVHVSRVTFGWVEEWVQFAFVVFLAFVVMVEQGPNRNARRGKPTPSAIQSLLPKAD